MVVGGIVILLNNFKLFEGIDPLIWAALFTVVGLGFLVAYVLDRRRRVGSLVPVFTLLGLAAIVYLGGKELVSDSWLGTIFLASIGLGFWLTFLVNRDHWWAVIPGGTLWVLAVLAFLSESSDMSTNALGGVLFIGLGLTLGLLYMLRSRRRPLEWAAIPGMALFLFGLIVFLGAMEIQAQYWPLLLIFLGIGLLIGQVRAFRPAPVPAPAGGLPEPIRPQPIEPLPAEAAVTPMEKEAGMAEVAGEAIAEDEPLVTTQVITPPASGDESPWWEETPEVEEVAVEEDDARETRPWMSEVEAEPLVAEVDEVDVGEEAAEGALLEEDQADHEDRAADEDWAADEDEGSRSP